MTERPGQPPLRFRPSHWPLWSARLLLFSWWILIATATHVRLDAQPTDVPVPDKLIHFFMYAVLGLLLPMWHGWREPLNGKQATLYFSIIVLYAILDELLQIPVGRTAEWLDGAADLLGGASGLLTAAMIRNMLMVKDDEHLSE